jgi:hypothetical protein
MINGNEIQDLKISEVIFVTEFAKINFNENLNYEKLYDVNISRIAEWGRFHDVIPQILENLLFASKNNPEYKRLFV